MDRSDNELLHELARFRQHGAPQEAGRGDHGGACADGVARAERPVAAHGHRPPLPGWSSATSAINASDVGGGTLPFPGFTASDATRVRAE